MSRSWQMSYSEDVDDFLVWNEDKHEYERTILTVRGRLSIEAQQNSFLFQQLSNQRRDNWITFDRHSNFMITHWTIGPRFDDILVGEWELMLGSPDIPTVTYIPLVEYIEDYQNKGIKMIDGPST